MMKRVQFKMFLKTEKVKMLIFNSNLIFDNNQPYKVYTLKSADDRFCFKTNPEPTKRYLGVYQDKGVVGKYANFSGFDGSLITSYVDCTLTYGILSGKIKSVLVDNQEVFNLNFSKIDN